MKKIILTTVLAITTLCNAQMSFGVKSGLNIADKKIDLAFSVFENNYATSLKTESFYSFYVGFFAEYKLKTKGLSLVSELYFTQNGTTILDDKRDLSDGDLFSNNESTLTIGGSKLILNQINLPILVKYTTPLNVFATAGMYFGYITNAKSDKENITERINKFDYGLCIGVGYQFKNNLLIDARYNIGLSKIIDISESKEFVSSSVKSYNRSFQIGLGYKFL